MNRPDSLKPGDKLRFKDNQFPTGDGTFLYERGEEATFRYYTCPGEDQKITDLISSSVYPGIPGPFIYITTHCLTVPLCWFERDIADE